MKKYIDAEKFKSMHMCCGYIDEMSEEQFDSFPASDVVPIKRAHWIVSETDYGFCESIGKNYKEKKYKCSACGYETGTQAEKFVCCPICTATMDEMNKHEITPGIYRKFDGSMYRVANLLVNNETGNVAVAYHSVGGGKLVFYLTPCEIFAAKVDKQKYPDATQEYCFEKVEDDYTIPDVVDTSRIACGSFTPPQNDFIRSLSQTNLVPVVRCRNCKYAYINSFAKESGVALCMHWTNRSDGVQMVMQFDDFCSYGEKKDG